MSFKFYCPEKFQKNWLSGLFKSSENPCLGSRFFGFKTMTVNNSESGLQYFIQKMAQYIIFEFELIIIQQCCPTFLIPWATKKIFSKPRAAPENSKAKTSF